MTLHADHIGSLLRPPELLEARAAHDRGDLGDDALERAEDDAIVAALEVQRAAGLQIFSDGEYRRSWFAGGLPSVIDGLVDNDEAISLQWEGAGSSAATKVTTEVKLGTSRAARRLQHDGTGRREGGHVPARARPRPVQGDDDRGAALRARLVPARRDRRLSRHHLDDRSHRRDDGRGGRPAVAGGHLLHAAGLAALRHPRARGDAERRGSLARGDPRRDDRRRQRRPRARARGRDHDGAAHVPRQQPQLLDRGGRLLRVRPPSRPSAASTSTGSCSSTTPSAPAASPRCASCPTPRPWCWA